jgi:TRAP-type mannitol/chloroaromatic compound transport system permease small subunit
MIELEPGSVEHVGHPEEPPHSPFGLRLLAASRSLAYLGGTIMILLIAMSLISIVGRKLFSLPIPGDLEIMQMGAAVAAAMFFPWCQINDSHVRVDFFTTRLPLRFRAALDGIAASLLGMVMLLLSWRTGVAALASKQSGDSSVMLGLPQWIAEALIVPSLIVFALTGLYIARRRFRLACRGTK